MSPLPLTPCNSSPALSPSCSPPTAIQNLVETSQKATGQHNETTMCKEVTYRQTHSFLCHSSTQPHTCTPPFAGALSFAGWGTHLQADRPSVDQTRPRVGKDQRCTATQAHHCTAVSIQPAVCCCNHGHIRLAFHPCVCLFAVLQ